MFEKGRHTVAQPTSSDSSFQYLLGDKKDSVDYYQELQKNLAVASVSVPNASTIAATTPNSATTPSSTASAQGKRFP